MENFFVLSLSLKVMLKLRSLEYTPMYHTSFFMIFQADHNGGNFLHDFPVSGVVEDFPK